MRCIYSIDKYLSKILCLSLQDELSSLDRSFYNVFDHHRIIKIAFAVNKESISWTERGGSAMINSTLSFLMLFLTLPFFTITVNSSTFRSIYPPVPLTPFPHCGIDRKTSPVSPRFLGGMYNTDQWVCCLPSSSGLEYKTLAGAFPWLMHICPHFSSLPFSKIQYGRTVSKFQ